MSTVRRMSDFEHGQSGVRGRRVDQITVRRREVEALVPRDGHQQAVEGSSFGRTSAALAMACSSDTGSTTAPAPTSASRNRSGATGSLPRRCLIATSQTLAAETTHDEAAIRRRAAADSRFAPTNHQSATCVSSSSLTVRPQRHGQCPHRPCGRIRRRCERQESRGHPIRRGAPHAPWGRAWPSGDHCAQ